MKLLPLLDILLLRNEALIPPEVNPLNDLADFGHAIQRGCIIHPVLYGCFDAFAETIWNHEVRQNFHDLIIQIFHINIGLAARFISALACQTAIVGFLVVGVPEGAHLAVVVIHQSCWLVGNAFRAEHPIMQDVGAMLAGDSAATRQAGTHFLADIEQLVGDEALMFAIVPDFPTTRRLFALSQSAVVQRFSIRHPPGIGPVLQHVAYHLFIDRLLASAKLLDDGLQIHPVRDLLVAVVTGGVHAKRTPYNSGHAQHDVQTCWLFLGRLCFGDQKITNRSDAAVEFTSNRSLSLCAFGIGAQIARKHRGLHGQHLLNHRTVETVIVVLADTFHAVQLQLVLVTQKGFDDHRLLEITRQAVKLPDHQRIKLALLRGFLHLLEVFAIQTPATFSAIFEHSDYHATACTNRFAANRFLVFQTDFVLHVA